MNLFISAVFFSGLLAMTGCQEDSVPTPPVDDQSIDPGVVTAIEKNSEWVLKGLLGESYKLTFSEDADVEKDFPVRVTQFTGAQIAVSFFTEEEKSQLVMLNDGDAFAFDMKLRSGRAHNTDFVVVNLDGKCRAQSTFSYELEFAEDYKSFSFDYIEKVIFVSEVLGACKEFLLAQTLGNPHDFFKKFYQDGALSNENIAGLSGIVHRKGLFKGTLVP